MIKKLLFILIIAVNVSFIQPGKKWVAIGDSITYLNDHPNETGNRITKGYLTGVTEKLPNIQVTNQGHNGWTSGQIAQEFDKLGIEKAEIYSVFLGTNDWWRGRPLGTFLNYQNDSGNATVFGSFRIIVNKLRALNKDARIVLITPMQRGDFVYINDMKNNAYGSYKKKDGQTLAAFAAAVKMIGDHEHFTVIDLYNQKELALKNLVKFKRLKDPLSGRYRDYHLPAYINVPFNPNTDSYPYPPEAANMTYDGLHPSDKGYEVITRLLVRAFKK